MYFFDGNPLIFVQLLLSPIIFQNYLFYHPQLKLERGNAISKENFYKKNKIRKKFNLG